MNRWLVYVTLVVFLGVLLGCVGLVFPIEIVLTLGLGWIQFIGQTLPRVRIDGPGVISGAVVLILLIGVTHSFCGWLTRQMSGRTWRPGWTARLLGSVVILFGAGIAATGVAHQVGWLLISPEPWISTNSTAAMRSQSVNNLKQVGLALYGYADSQGTMPPAAEFDARGRVGHGWQARILPYMEQDKLYNQIDFAVSWDEPRNVEIYRTPVQAYLVPGRSRPPQVQGLAASHYAGNVLVLGGDRAWRFAEMTDGTSNTFIAGEVAGRFRPWGDPLQWRDPRLGINRSRDGFGSPWPGGANFLFGDGSVRFLKNTVDPDVFRAVATPDGGEMVSSDQY